MISSIIVDYAHASSMWSRRYINQQHRKQLDMMIINPVFKYQNASLRNFKRGIQSSSASSQGLSPCSIPCNGTSSSCHPTSSSISSPSSSSDPRAICPVAAVVAASREASSYDELRQEMMHNLEALDQKIDDLNRIAYRRHVMMVSVVGVLTTILASVAMMYMQDTQNIVENTTITI